MEQGFTSLVFDKVTDTILAPNNAVGKGLDDGKISVHFKPKLDNKFSSFTPGGDITNQLPTN